jgi:hypothetical protein
MAVAGPPLAYSRRVALRGAYTLTLYRGRIVASAWPRKHRARPKKSELARRTWLQDIVKATQYADPHMTAAVRDAVGGSATLSRDFLTMMIAGTAFSTRLANGQEILPIRFRRLLFAALDKIALQGGGIAARHPAHWITVAPAPAGSVLTSQGSNAVPTWA